MLGIPGKHIPNDLSTIRAIQCPSSLCKNHELDRSRTQEKRSKNSSLPGRFPLSTQGSPNINEPNGVHDDVPPRPGLANKCSKIFNNTIKRSRVPRDQVEYTVESKTAEHRETRQNKIKPFKVDREKTLELAGRQNSPRKAEFCIVRGATRKITLQNLTKSSQRSAKNEAPQEIPNTGRRFIRTKLVAKERSHTLSNPLSFAHGIYYNGCGRQRLGSSSKRPSTLGYVASGPEKVAQQQKRTLGRTRSIAKTKSRAKREIDMSAVRQPHHRGLHHETRRHKIIDITANRHTDIRTLPQAKMPLDSTIHSGPIQRHSRRAFESESSSGMAPQYPGVRTDFQTTGSPRNRPFRFRTISSSPVLRQRRLNGQKQPVYRRLQQDMAVQTGLDFSPSFADPSSASPSKVIPRKVPPRNTILGTSILGTGGETTRTGSACRDKEPTSELTRSTNGQNSPRGRQIKISSLEGTGWADHLKDWNDSEVRLLENSWRLSTLKTYKPAWLRWQNWAVSHLVQTNNPSPQHLAKYLCHLFIEEKLAPRTVALHKSVVTTFSNPGRSEELNSHPLVRQVLKGIFSQNPPIKKPLSWKIEDLLNFLKHYPLNENNLFSVSRHAATLLLLASGRRVHDLTLLSIKEDAFEDKGQEMVFHPNFGSKTDSSSYRQPGWIIKSSEHLDERFNLVLWVRKLLKVSSPRRSSGNVCSLFITTRGVIKSASRSIIAGWIRTLFKEARISASAGSFRAAVASDIWSSNRYNIEDVLKRGNWRSKTTFFNHYFKEAPRSERPINNTLIDSFSTIS